MVSTSTVYCSDRAETAALGSNTEPQKPIGLRLFLNSITVQALSVIALLPCSTTGQIGL